MEPDARYTAELIKASCLILSFLYGLIGIFPFFWGFPGVSIAPTEAILLLYGPFLFMAIGFFIITRFETSIVHGATILGLVVIDFILMLILVDGSLGTIFFIAIFAMIYFSYFTKAYSLFDAHRTPLRGFESLFIALSQKLIFVPLIYLFLLLLSLVA